MPGVVLRPRGPVRFREPAPTAASSLDCLVRLVDGRVPPRPPRDHPLILYPQDVVAVEVYPTFGEVPAELRQLAYGGGATWGVILYRSRARW